MNADQRSRRGDDIRARAPHVFETYRETRETVLELEKGVVLEEMRQGEDNPRRLLSRRLHELLFEGHPYGRPVIGTPEIIRGLSRETLVSFYRRHYVPESFVLVVVGPVVTAEVLAA